MILAILQARMSSKRLPGKVLMPIKGIPMLLIMVDRVRNSKMIDKLVIATSYEKEDDKIIAFCKEYDIECKRGNLNDVLDRFFWISQIYFPAHVVRMTADCPLIDPGVIDKTIQHHLMYGYDFTWNPGFPDGLDVEVMTHATLATAWRDADTSYDREHVTSYIRNNPMYFKIGRYENGVDLSKVKLSVDTPEDLYIVSRFIDLCLNSTMEILKAL
jgi:spore coat polysaccharide biosynthesis protein SpsF